MDKYEEEEERRRTHEILYTSIPYGSGVGADGRLNVRDGEKKIQSLRSQKTGHVMLMIFRATPDAGATSIWTAASVGFGQLRVPLCHFFSHERKEERKERKRRRERVNKSEHGKSTSAIVYINLYPIKRTPQVQPVGVPPFCANDPPWPSNGYIIYQMHTK